MAGGLLVVQKYGVGHHLNDVDPVHFYHLLSVCVPAAKSRSLVALADLPSRPRSLPIYHHVPQDLDLTALIPPLQSKASVPLCGVLPYSIVDWVRHEFVTGSFFWISAAGQNLGFVYSWTLRRYFSDRSHY